MKKVEPNCKISAASGQSTAVLRIDSFSHSAHYQNTETTQNTLDSSLYLVLPPLPVLLVVDQ